MLNQNAQSQDLNNLICKDTGSLGTRLTTFDLKDFNSNGVFLEHAHRNHVLRFEKAYNSFSFYRSSPGIGTLIIHLDTAIFLDEKDQKYECVIRWTPEEFNATITSSSGVQVYGEGKRSPKMLKANNDYFFTFGDAGIQTMGATVIHNGSILAEPSALEQWEDIKTACNHVISHENNGDYFYKTIVYGQLLCMTVTGFENFLKRRFFELEQEGVFLDKVALEKKFPKGDRHINFQSYDEARKAYKAGYRLVFGNIVSNVIIDLIKRYLKYRHRIVHVTPLPGALNIMEVAKGSEQSEHANADMLTCAFAAFDKLVSELNKKTLYLERNPL